MGIKGIKLCQRTVFHLHSSAVDVHTVSLRVRELAVLQKHLTVRYRQTVALAIMNGRRLHREFEL